MTILSIVGARPNFMKVAPLHRAFEATGRITSRIVHTGQHYDEEMSDVFFRQLGLPEPDVYLGVGSASHAVQTARVMTAFEEVLDAGAPDLVLVVGDVNSTLACSLVAAKRHVPVAHVEAGLRSGDRRMPEELNRIVTDQLSDLLFVTERSGVENLRREGVPEEKIHFVGNVMIDALVAFRERAAETKVEQQMGLPPGRYVAMTLHRPSNVDAEGPLRKVLATIEQVAREAPVAFPLHPRTRSRFEEHGLMGRVEAIERLHVTEPLGYLEFLRLMEQAGAVVTDSGGIQEETTFLGVPCLTLRENTERPVTIEQGTNELLPLQPERIARRVRERLAERSDGARPAPPPLWDGHAAERIAEVVLRTSRTGFAAG